MKRGNMHLRKVLAVFALAVTAMCLCGVANAQELTASASSTLTYSAPESISVTISPSGTFSQAATPTLTSPLAVNFAWNVAASRSAFALDYGFEATNAMTSGSNAITSGNISASEDGATATPCNQNPSAIDPMLMAGATCIPYTTALTSANDSGNSTQMVQLSIANASTLPVGSYTGVFYVFFGIQ
jgi:hypothetical protein